MDINKIKERLAALRPEDLDPEDPEIGELLMLVEEDLELAEWFAQEQVFDQNFAAKLQEITPPAGLDERILEAMKQAQSATDTAPVPTSTGEQAEDAPALPINVPVAQEPKLEETPDDEKITEFKPETTEEAAAQEIPTNEGGAPCPFNPDATKRRWWQNPSFISAAAAVVLMLVVGIMMFDSPELQAEDLDQFYQDISQHHASNQPLSLESTDLSAINEYLSQKGAPTCHNLPENIDPLPEVGCTIMQWGGQIVSVVRMQNHEQVDVYIVRSGLFPDFSSKPQPQTVTLEQMVVLAWSDGDMIYFLVRSGDLEELESLL
ncbi:hypothetical protein [Cerasicoccus maritimus]|uniref:hypothetical protein n=1 Tax=Cerasicoccus maritimus TaxID=490089 RepID=UPI002852A3A8|nr:hypothetical protein [Cerasicoccus maritimus]